MADVKISALPSATTPLAGTEVLPIVQSATTDQVSVANLTAGRAVSAASLTLTTTPLAVGSGGTGLTSLTAGYIPYASSTSALSFSSNLYSTGTNIGIGTAIPATTFNVVGNAFFDGTTRVRQSGSTRYRSDWRMSAGEASVNAYDDTGGVYIPYKLEASTFSVYTGTGASNPMVLNSSGNLGVGTTTPALKFVVSNGGAQGLEIDPTAVASAPVLLSYNRSGASFVALSFRASNFVWYDAANNQAMTLDASGNLGIGTTTIASRLSIDAPRSDTAGTGWLRLTEISQTGGRWAQRVSSANGYCFDYYNGSSWSNFVFINSAGDFLVDDTSNSATSGSGIKLLAADGGANTPRVAIVTAGSTSGSYSLSTYSTGAGAYRFFVNDAGTINATSTTITGISDRRLKENIVDLDVGLDALLALKPRKFDWKSGKGKDIKGDRGWVADEFQQVFPDMVEDWLDAPPEGEEPYKAVRPDLIPVLVKAIQELAAKVAELEAKI